METVDSRKKLQLQLRSTILDRPRVLVIDPEYIEFDDQDTAASAPTKFEKTDIEGLRFGIKGIHGFAFLIGRIYCVDVRDISGRVIKIRLKSIYGIRKKLLEDKYADITNALLEYFFHDKIRDHLKQFQAERPIQLLGVKLNQHAVLFDKKVGWVSWACLRTKQHWHYFTLYSEESPNNYKAFVLLDDWNASVLLGLVEAILTRKSLNC